MLILDSSVYAQEAFTASIQGPYLLKHANGRVHIKGTYQNGLKHGVWFEYEENGMLQKKEKWKRGEMLWQLFYEKGKLRRSIDKKGNVKERPACGC
jgi:antitoxin component YwqK of YwqJK toxin-antitoxin module